jgi:hypothetical protein
MTLSDAATEPQADSELKPQASPEKADLWRAFELARSLAGTRPSGVRASTSMPVWQRVPLAHRPASRSVSVMPGPWPSRMNHSVPNPYRNASSGMARKKDASLIWLACARMARRLSSR